MSTETNRILITGAAGFIGSHICDRFINEGFDVIGMDNLITGDLNNIEHLFKEKNFHFFHHDVTRFVHIPGQLDHILHFASPASPIDYLKIPIQTLKVGSLGTHNMLGLARNKQARILVASTSEVYGDPLVHPQNEAYFGNVNPIGPRGVYDEAKRFQEAITMAYHTYHGLETRIARIFNTYGPRMRLNDGRVLPAFIGQALRNEDLTVFGDGNQTRSFCFVDDLIEGIYRLLFSDYSQPLNIGNPDEITINDFADKDEQIERREDPIDGANDGASGVAVLLEIARVIHAAEEKPEVGIDIILFDGEDWGERNDGPKTSPSGGLESWWCLGSQHWSKNKHLKNYSAYYGILLDMVGGRNAQFRMEGLSDQYAGKVVKKIWDWGNALGHGMLFVYEKEMEIMDDHKFVNEVAMIPTVNIVHFEPPYGYFGDFHHTHKDNLNLIDKEVLRAVGETVLYVIYHE